MFYVCQSTKCSICSIFYKGEYLRSLFKTASYMQLVAKKKAKGTMCYLNVLNGKLMEGILIKRYSSTSGHSRKMVFGNCNMNHFTMSCLAFYV
jgi:hypothetical protein